MTELIDFAYDLLFDVYLFGLIFLFICLLFHTPGNSQIDNSKTFLEKLMTEEIPQQLITEEGNNSSKLLPVIDNVEDTDFVSQSGAEYKPSTELESQWFGEETLLIATASPPEMTSKLPVIVTIDEQQQRKQNLMNLSTRKLQRFCSKASIPGYSAYLKRGKEALVDFLLGLSIDSSHIVESLQVGS